MKPSNHLNTMNIPSHCKKVYFSILVGLCIIDPDLKAHVGTRIVCRLGMGNGKIKSLSTFIIIGGKQFNGVFL